MADETPELDPPIAAMLDATNRGDSEAFLAAFADDAVLDDWGRTFTGKAEIARWNSNENIGVQSQIEATSVTRQGSAWPSSGSPCPGNGYNGGGSFVFETAGGLIRGSRSAADRARGLERVAACTTARQPASSPASRSSRRSTRSSPATAARS